MSILFLWLFIGFIVTLIVAHIDWNKGEDFKVSDIGIAIVITGFGPIIGLLMLIIWLNDSKKILIRGKSKMEPEEPSEPNLKKSALDDK